MILKEGLQPSGGYENLAFGRSVRLGGPGLEVSMKEPSEGVFRKVVDATTRQVHISSPLEVADYEQITPKKDMAMLKRLADSLRGKRISFFGATEAGGGVALMRTTQVPLLQQIGVDARWYVLEPDESAFRVTKGKLHNVFQKVAAPDVRLTGEDKHTYNQWTERNAQALKEPLTTSDVIIIDDWQPSGLIPHIKASNPHAKIIFRDHIQSEGKLMSETGTPQHTSWDFIWNHNMVRAADLFVAHPVAEFVPDDVPEAITVFMAPSTDPLDGLNRTLSAEEMAKGIECFNDRLRENEGQSPLDPKRPYVIQVARFDPSKGIDTVLKSYEALRHKMQHDGITQDKIPQLVITGNGSVDDPDGAPILAETMRLRSEIYGRYADDIKVARVPHSPFSDETLNALVRKSEVLLQLSLKEGFEVKATEAQMKGVPVVVTRAGGLPLQVADGLSGFLVEPGDYQAVADHVHTLLTDSNKRALMSAGALRQADENNYKFTTIPNTLGWMHLCHELLENPQFSGNGRKIWDIASASSLR